MNISILSVFSELYDSFLKTSLVRRAQENNHVSIEVDTLFSFVQAKERIDAPAFGPGAGMVLRPEVIERAITAQEKKHGQGYKIFFSPRGKKLDQERLRAIAHKMKQSSHLILVPARYEGMDDRVEEYYADEILSVGDFVLMGGDLPAMMLLEGLLRLMPGVVGKQESVEQDSFSGAFVDFPVYTEPGTWHEMSVPDVIRSGNHGAIEKWRKEQAVKKTVLSHFSWLRSHQLTAQEKNEAQQFIPQHYLVLSHSDVLIGPENTLGTTSVTSIDIHDIARSAHTYGFEQFFVVTPLKDQQKIVQTLLDFWQKGPGFSYNRSRFEAVKSVQLKNSMADVIEAIEKETNKKPIIISTSARQVENVPRITFYDQDKVWADQRPVVIVLGTGKGLSEEFIRKSDYTLLPLDGFSDFNHLSVRSAAAIILDRWLGINSRSLKD